jgi:hypothetical protein
LQKLKGIFEIYTKSLNIAKPGDVSELLDTFDSISLNELNKLTPLRRIDKKYICHKAELPKLLSALLYHYNVLDIQGNRNFKYSNIYFDTKDSVFFISHINGKLGRYKVRLRHYHETDENYIEIKHKNNRKETMKHRIRVPEFDKDCIGEHYDDISLIIPFTIDKLKPAVYNNYKRITLLKPDIFDKITIDFDILTLTSDGGHISLNNLVIIEHKSVKHSSCKVLNETLKSIQSTSLNLSKYCLSSIMTKQHLKYNPYKSKLLTIKKICNGYNSEFSQYAWNSTVNGFSG